MKSFLAGKKSLSAPSLVMEASPLVSISSSSAPAARTPPAPGKTVAAANIDVVKEGDKVVRLVITCACGERMEVECLYPAGV